MAKERDLNEIAKIEKAIKDKYGTEAIQNPKGSWSEEKEKRYLKDLKKFYDKTLREKSTESVPGFLIKTRISKERVERECPICGSYSFSSRDDLYMIKFECCFQCYVQYIEGREERWKTGWRPNN